MIFFLGALFSGVLALSIIVLGLFTFFATIVGWIGGGVVYHFTKNTHDWKSVWTIITAIIVIIGFISLIGLL